MCLGVVLLLAFVVAWPTHTTDLKCGAEGIVRESFPDMDSCVSAMTGGCYCSVRDRWFIPIIYLLIIPWLVIRAVRGVHERAARGANAVWFVLIVVLLLQVLLVLPYAGVRLPRLIQTAIFAWPQLVFFGPGLYNAQGPVLSEPSQYLGTLLFWLLAGFVFGILSGRLRARWFIPLAVAFVASMTLLVRLAIPVLGLRQVLEFP